jgi:uncharacterized membrane protein
VVAMLVFGTYSVYLLLFSNATMENHQSFWYLWVIGLPVSLVTYLFRMPWAMDNLWRYPWWLDKK